LSPLFVCLPTFLPSLVIGIKDLILFPTVLFQMGMAILPDLIDENGKIVASTNLSSNEKSFILEPRHEVIEFFSSYEWLFKDGIFNPIFYPHLQDMSDNTLHFFSSHDDPIIDYGLSFLSRWKGKLTMDVFPVLKHGWFYFEALATICFRGQRKRMDDSENVLFQRFMETLNQPPNKPLEVNDNT